MTTSDFEDALRLFVPFESFESLEDTLAGPKQESGISLESEWQARLAEQMQDVAVEVSGVLASIELPLREVLGLKSVTWLIWRSWALSVLRCKTARSALASSAFSTTKNQSSTA